MNERQSLIINKSTIALVDQPRETGGHGYQFEERPITFIGSNEPPLEAVRIIMAPFDLREEILERWESIVSVSSKIQDI